jgi:ferric-dicitrate binding protein FerR (iron transport regulator)
MTDSHEDFGDHSDDDLDRILREGLRTGPPDPAAMQRLREVAAREWQLSVERRQRRRPSHYRLWASAAAVACLAVAAGWFFRPGALAQQFGVVLRADAGETVIVERGLHNRPLQAGVALKAGDGLASHGPVLIALAAGGSLRVAPDTELKFISAMEVALQRGRIYVDFPPGAHPAAFGVRTRAGMVEHVGTEFEVSSNEQIVRIRVREGRVRLRGGSGETLLEAGTQLIANRDGTVSRTTVALSGGDWLWVTALAPDYEIEGQPLLNFLEWASRELGRPLKFSDPHSREVAERTILHGSIKGRDPMDALGSILSTTSLTYELRGDTIWIQSGNGT